MVLRVIGRGTWRESVAVQECVLQAAPPHGTTCIDLSRCDYLDSTFMGMLLRVNRELSGDGLRFSIAVPTPLRGQLFKTTQLETVLQLCDQAPAVVDDLGQVPTHASGPDDVASHVLAAHEELLNVVAASRESFAAVIELLSRELRRHSEHVRPRLP